jgi:hypothetical protein
MFDVKKNEIPMFNETNHVLDTCICICTIHTHIYDKSRTTFGVDLVPIISQTVLSNKSHISNNNRSKNRIAQKQRYEKY